MQQEKNKQVIREFSRIFKNEHNVNGVGHLFDETFVHHFRGPMPLGFEGFRQIGIMMNGAFPDVSTFKFSHLRFRHRVCATLVRLPIFLLFCFKCFLE